MNKNAFGFNLNKQLVDAKEEKKVVNKHKKKVWVIILIVQLDMLQKYVISANGETLIQKM